jgi:hypothetical protein
MKCYGHLAPVSIAQPGQAHIDFSGEPRMATSRKHRMRRTGSQVAASLALVPVVLAWGGSARPAGEPEVRVLVADRAVDIGLDHRPLVEPHLAVSPRDDRHLVGADIVIEAADLSATGCAAFASFDGGESWKSTVLDVSACGDPWIVFHPDGTVLLAVLGQPLGTDSERLLLYRSRDGGLNWEQAADFGGGHDHPTMTMDASNGPTHGSIYVLSMQSVRRGSGVRDALFVARTTDSGATFHDADRTVLSTLGMNVMNGVVLADGTLGVVVSDYSRRAAEGGTMRLERPRDWLLLSRDGGANFEPPAFVGERCSRGFPALAADTERERLFVVCNDGSYENILLYSSADKGQRWFEPVVINAGSGRSPYVRTAAVETNAAGTVGVSWYDARADRAAYRSVLRCQELFFGASLDGGRTFLPEIRLSTARNCPGTPGNGEAGLRWPAGGDYTGLATDARGRFHLLWADSRSGVYQLRYALVETG